jgi:hypothetical protein
MSEKDISMLTSEMIANGIEDLKKRDEEIRQLLKEGKLINTLFGPITPKERDELVKKLGKKYE